MYDYIFLGRATGSDAEKEEVRREILEFRETIPGIVSMTAGFHEKGGGDHNWAVHIRFEDRADREAYATNEIHVAVGKRYGHFLERRTLVEFEVEPGAS